MTEIDFGTLVTAVIGEMNCTTSELSGDELTNPDRAVKRYNGNVIGRIRRVFDEAEAPAPVVPTCSNCGAILGPDEARFCHQCGTPQTMEAAAELLGDLLAKDAGIARDNPRLQAALARVREEEPEAWNALLKKISPRAAA